MAHDSQSEPALNLTLTELSEYFTANPNAFDSFLVDHIGSDLRTIRAGLSLADTISRPAWKETVKTSMTLSSHVQRYVSHRDESGV
jgi:hypothetical protein